MVNKLFNSSFEMELRVATLLSSDCSKVYSIERILILDFMACYAKEFGFADGNLHGDNSFMYGELSSRRELVQEAIKYLVCRGAVDVKIDRGYYYKITPIGSEYIMSLESEYAQEYRKIVNVVNSELNDYTDDQLMKMVQYKSDYKRKGV